MLGFLYVSVVPLPQAVSYIMLVIQVQSFLMMVCDNQAKALYVKVLLHGPVLW